MKIARSGVAALVLLVACSSDVVDAVPSTTSTTTTSTTTTTVAVTRTVTEIEWVPAPELGSEGSIRVGDTVFDFDFECYAAGAGDVLALGLGESPDGTERTQAVVQAFLGDPYVAVFVGDSVAYELAVDRQAELFVQDSAIRGGALRFVEPGDVAGAGPAAGLGSVTVECEGFAPGLPEGYSSE